MHITIGLEVYTDLAFLSARQNPQARSDRYLAHVYAIYSSVERKIA